MFSSRYTVFNKETDGKMKRKAKSMQFHPADFFCINKTRPPLSPWETKVRKENRLSLYTLLKWRVSCN